MHSIVPASSTNVARPIALIAAPSNLGLRDLTPGHEPGTWRAPAVLLKAGLPARLRAASVVELARPAYAFDEQPGTRIRNGLTIRRHAFELAHHVRTSLERGDLPVVVGGDCSILLGCLLGARRIGPVGLVHVDGHSDFSHPGNYPADKVLGAAAGMDLALATGFGEATLTEWPGLRGPLVPEALVTQIGERDELEPNFYAGLTETAFRRFPVRQVLADGIAAIVAATVAPVDGRTPPLWLHVDLDVLDETVMPAVDSPGSPGLDFARLTDLIGQLLATGRVIGLDVTIYDPERDPGHALAPAIVSCLAAALASPP
jgi:arginase